MYTRLIEDITIWSAVVDMPDQFVHLQQTTKDEHKQNPKPKDLIPNRNQKKLIPNR